MSSFKQIIQPLCVLALASFTCHFWILVNDGIYWDGWIYYHLLKSGQWQQIYLMYTSMGLPIISFVHKAMAIFPNIIKAYKYAIFLCLILNSFLLYAIAAKSKVLDKRAALIFSLIATVYPADQTWIETASIQYILGLTLFLLAAWTTLSLDPDINNCKSIKKNWIFFQLAPALIFTLSFNINSLLSFYFGFLLLWYFLSYSHLSVVNLVIFLKARLVFVASPFIYWFAKNIFYKPFGAYASYNTPDIDLKIFSKSIFFFSKNSIFLQITSALYESYKHPIVFTSLFILYFLLLFKHLTTTQKDDSNKTNDVKSIFIFSLILFFLGSLPYGLVGKYPSVEGWNTRHALLISIPVSLLFIALLKSIQSKLTHSLLSIFLISSFSTSLWINYSDWQARWIRDLSIIRQLNHKKDVLNFSTALVNDTFVIRNEPLRFYEWISIFKQVWPHDDRAAFLSINEAEQWIYDLNSSENSSKRFMYGILSEKQFSPPTIRIQIRKKSDISNLKVSSLYVFYCLFGRKYASELEQLIDDHTFVKIDPITQ